MSSLQFWVTFLLSAMISLASAMALMRLPSFSKWVARSDFRRKHKSPIPQIGGVAILISLLGFAVSTLQSPLHLILTAALPLIVAGVLDDIYELSAKPKLAAQLASVVAWLILSGTDQLVLHQLGWSGLLGSLVTGFWVIGMINATNMIDGMDGLAGTFALITALIMGLMVADAPSSGDLVVVAGAVTGFLALNRPPARIYLGDMGSNLIGFILACYAASLPSGEHWNSVFSPLLFLSYPAIDAVLAIGRRFTAKSSLFKGDHDHIHHKMQKLGLKVPQVLIFVAIVVLATALAATAVSKAKAPHVAELVTLAVTLSLSGLLAMVYYSELRLAQQISSLSHTIISEFVPMNPQPEFDAQSFSATTYDLLPYYKELQQSGILAVKDFIRDLSLHLAKIHGPQVQFTMAGSYTIIAINPGRNSPDPSLLAKGFQEILKRHGVMKNLDRPWGLTVYAGDAGREVFLRKFSSLQNFKPSVSLDKVS